MNKPPPTRIPGTGMPPEETDNVIAGVLVLLGVGAALALVGVQVFAWFL